MSYPDYTNEESLRITPVVDVISDLTAAVNLRVRNMNAYAPGYLSPTWFYGGYAPEYPGRQIPELPDLNIYPLVQAILLIRGKINEIGLYCRPATMLDYRWLGNYFRMDNEIITRAAGYPAGYIDYAFQPCRAEIFIQLKRVIEQLKYFDAYWYVHFDTSTEYLFKACYHTDDLPAFHTAAYAAVAGKNGSVVSKSRNPSVADAAVHASGTTNIPFNIALYYAQRDMLGNNYNQNYVEDYWTDMWNLGESGFMQVGYYEKGGNIDLPIRYPNLPKVTDKTGRRFSELYTAALCDISVDYTVF